MDGLKRFVELSPSPSHGLNFCQGTVSEMLKKPGEEIYDVIRYFGSRGRIFNVHFRNIKGGFLNFQETFPDNGDVDFIRAIRTYKEVGYDGLLMPDHVPVIDQRLWPERDRDGATATADPPAVGERVDHLRRPERAAIAARPPTAVVALAEHERCGDPREERATRWPGGGERLHGQLDDAPPTR